MHYQLVSDERELAELLKTPGSRLLCGGTDLLVKLRAGLLDAELLVDISEVASLQGIRQTNEFLEIGATTPETELLRAESILSDFPVLHQALSQLGSTQIRNRGTLGGNLVNASPAADSAVPLLLYDAALELASPDGKRMIPLREFLTGPGQTALAEGEYVRALRLPIAPSLNWTHYHKVGKRNALTIAIASVGMAGTLQGGAFREIRIAAGSVAPTAKRLPDVEKLIKDAPIADLPFERIRAAALDSVSPISDVRATADYRREVVADLIVRALRGAA